MLNFFDADPGRKNSNPEARINIPDPQALINRFFMNGINLLSQKTAKKHLKNFKLRLKNKNLQGSTPHPVIGIKLPSEYCFYYLKAVPVVDSQ